MASDARGRPSPHPALLILVTGKSAQASPIACPNGPDTFEIAVIVGDGEFAGIAANSCLDGQIHDPRDPAGDER